jgi:DNA topoisomerase-1
LIEAGKTRHEVDWLFGINLSRALTNAAKNWSGRYATLSTGRVQGPVLKFLVAREKAIGSFVPAPFWQVKAQVGIDGQILEAEYDKEAIETRKEAEAIVSDCEGKNARIERIDVRRFHQPPPLPFDLGSLQAESYRLFRHSPKQTSSIAQRLYLDALISYPRTSSQKLPPAIDYNAILKNLCRIDEHKKLATELLAEHELRPNEGKKEDPAHPAIYPTGNLPDRSLTGPERNVWSLVIRRFMVVFAQPATRETVKVNIDVNGHTFRLGATRTLDEGWIRFYKPYARFEEAELPPVEEGQTFNLPKVFIEDHFTKPPARYNAGSLLRRMEKSEIGTKATRADIIQTLYSRRYVRDERMRVTDLGFEVVEVLRRHCPRMISVKMTRDLEARMDRIREDKEKRENVLADTIRTLEPVLQELREREKTIGEQLSGAVRQAALEDRTVGPCPACKTGKLMVIHSRKTGKRFVGCSNYFEKMCKASFPLPQTGLVKPLGRSCSACGWPTIQVRTRGRPWILCFNPDCPSKEERRKHIEVSNLQ